MDESARISRRATLVRLGGFIAGGGRNRRLEGSGLAKCDGRGGRELGPGRRRLGRCDVRARAGADRGPLLPRRPEDPAKHHGGKARRATGSAATVVDVATCRPIKGAAVDVWHCDARGVYSGTSVQGAEDERFLRGVQRTDAKGVALLRTIYPGWYPGRTVHIHVLVHLGGNVVHTGQLYFADAVTDAVYKRRPYASRPNRDPRNPGDSIYRNDGKHSTLKLVRSGSGYVGSITMGVTRS